MSIARDDIDHVRITGAPPEPERLSVDLYSWATICERCGTNLGAHLGWTCPMNPVGQYDGPLVLCGASPEPNLRAVNAALVAALSAALDQTEDGLHQSPCDEPNCWVEAAEAALKLASGGQA